MLSVNACALPPHSLLIRYRKKRHFVDSYCAEVNGTVSHAEYVTSFYTSWLFRLELLILRQIAKIDSTDKDVALLAQAQTDRFAAWKVEDREAEQLLLSDTRGRTRSWLMSEIERGEQGAKTMLYFGSAVLPTSGLSTRSLAGQVLFLSLLPFHKVYSRALLGAAKRSLSRSQD